MNRDFEAEGCLVTAGIVLVGFVISMACYNLGRASGALQENQKWQKETVVRGHAQHNEITGEWEWKDDTKAQGLD